jgi:outer membrane protein assembly factor BamB
VSVLRHALRRRGVKVAAGHKDPGTAMPRAIAWDASGRKLWDVVLPSVDPATVRERSNEADALVGGRYVAVYGTGSDRWHATALDAKTGARLWDVELKNIFAVDSIDGLVATKDHVFIERTSSLDVLEADTGALIGAIGTETYE